jgi:hypothetical protein
MPGEKFLPSGVFSLKCSVCGSDNPDNNQFCNSCGKPLVKPQAPMKQVTPASVPATPAPKGSGILPILLLGGALFLVAALAIGFFVILPMFEEGDTQAGEYDSGFADDSDIWEDDEKDSPAGSLVSDAGSAGSGTTGGLTSAPSPGTRSAPGAVVHGTISTGTSETVAQGTLPASGGTIAVSKPGSAIDGLKITAPAMAYPAGQPVTISSAPITGTTFGSNFNPATPLIEISAGSAYAEEPVRVTIPVTIPDDQFAMAFYYDQANQKLEGIPTSAQDASSITIATRHFSNIVVSFIPKNTLDKLDKVDSMFRPGTDDWEFSNAGSDVARGGHCAGQSVTMMWYFTEQRQKTAAPALYTRFDNNGREKTPDFGRDNTLGYRFASVFQKKMKWDEYQTKVAPYLENVTDGTTLREFRYSMLLTGEPQFVYIARNGGAHAMVCYEASGNTLWIADPNYPGKERMISLEGDSFIPYSSGENSQAIQQAGERQYPKIKYIAKTALYSWPDLADGYAKVLDGTIGNGIFTEYKLAVRVLNADGSEKKLILVPDVGRNIKHVPVEVDEKNVRILFGGLGDDASIYLYQDGKRVNNPLTLNEGTNTFAVEVKKINTLPDGNTTEAWLGFDWVDVVYKPASTAAAAPGLYTAREYHVPDAVWGTPDCKFRTYSDEPTCGQDAGIGQNSFAVACGKPLEKCIDYAWKDGIGNVYTYKLTISTGPDGKPVYSRIHDGYHRSYAKGGVLETRILYKEGKTVEVCSHHVDEGRFWCSVDGDPKIYYKAPGEVT